MSAPIHKRHTVSRLVYHLVCPARYRRLVVSGTVDQVLRDVCLEIAARYEVLTESKPIAMSYPFLTVASSN